MMRFGFDPSDYGENGIFSEKGGWHGFIYGMAIFFFCFLISFFYFAHTSLKTYTLDDTTLGAFSFLLTVIEVVVIYYIRNRNKNLAAYEEGAFDSTGGCWMLIAMMIGGLYLNCIVVNEINGRFDFSESRRVKGIISAKYSKAHSRKAPILFHYYLQIETSMVNGKQECIDIEVSESFYNVLKDGSEVEFETKPGLLGYEHISSEIKVLK